MPYQLYSNLKLIGITSFIGELFAIFITPGEELTAYIKLSELRKLEQEGKIPPLPYSEISAFLNVAKPSKHQIVHMTKIAGNDETGAFTINCYRIEITWKKLLSIIIHKTMDSIKKNLKWIKIKLIHSNLFCRIFGQ